MVRGVRLIVGMEVHVELMTRTKMFTRVGSPAHPEHDGSAHEEPNTLIDPVVLALPGSLPVLNRRAIDLSIRVGLALNCRIAAMTRWDRKSYFYPDLPKAYQISQFALPLCFDGSVDVPVGDAGGVARVGIVRAHLEEDAGKLLHEAPGGHRIEHSIVDLNRAGTPLLEIVTAPDMASADVAVAFAQWLHRVCRWLGATLGVMQRGHMRFEPNINTELTLSDGRVVRTPIVEVKNLNSFRAVRGAIEYELGAQPHRWVEDGVEHGPGRKSTRGWDDARGVTTPQREKEEAHDYRYFPDPDLLPATIDAAWVERIRAEMPELPDARRSRYREDYGLDGWECDALVAERSVSEFFETSVASACEMLGLGASGGAGAARCGRLVATVLLQNGAKLANERGGTVAELGVMGTEVGAIVALREGGEIGSNAIDPLLVALADRRGEAVGDSGLETVRMLAERLGLIQVRDASALRAWCEESLADPAHASAIEDVRGGKEVAVGRLVGSVMKRSGGKADAASVRAMLLEMIRAR